MADIFISYARENRESAERLATALQHLGFTVWWDFELLSGDRFRRVIQQVIDQCRAAVVLWSTHSIESDFVLDEAAYAKEGGKLCPARIDQVRLPFEFGQTQTDDLSNWRGELRHLGFQTLLRALESRIGREAMVGTVSTDAEAERASAELHAFKVAETAGNGPAFRAFLEQYPAGNFADVVREQAERQRIAE